MGRQGGEQLRLFDLIHGVGTFGLLLAGLTAATETRTVLALVAVGLALWIPEWVWGEVPELDDARRGRAVVVATQISILTLELGGALVSRGAEEPGLLLFYGTGCVLQVAGIVTTLRCGPDDLSLVAWGSIHGAMAFTALIALLSGAALWWGGALGTDLFAVWLVLRLLTTLSLLFLGMAFLMLMAALALGLLQERQHQRRAWMSLLWAQAALLVLFLRWPWNRI
ncbi:MAG: hypothetical protein KatS3mg108_1309 [Isosphaeraceae bacterium]|jgi:hypothetical protein|nr:MAG: hypothetical protein KatS3mg108_1309 [Isosphaeraceae bacterium]